MTKNHYHIQRKCNCSFLKFCMKRRCVSKKGEVKHNCSIPSSKKIVEGNFHREGPVLPGLEAILDRSVNNNEVV